MRGIVRRTGSRPGDLSPAASLHAQADPRRRGRRRSLRDLRLTIAAIPAPLLIAGTAWATTIETVTSPGKAKREGFHLTPLELGAATAVCAFVAAVFTVRTYYARIRERRADEASANPFEQARAAKAALAELSAFQSALADTDSSFERLQALRRDNMISARREVRLPRDAFAGDDLLLATHQRLLRRFIDACEATLEHVAAIRELVPLAAAHAPDDFNADVMKALVQAKSSLDRILQDRQMPLEDAENLIAQISNDIFIVTRDHPHDPKDLPDL